MVFRSTLLRDHSSVVAFISFTHSVTHVEVILSVTFKRRGSNKSLLLQLDSGFIYPGFEISSETTASTSVQ